MDIKIIRFLQSSSKPPRWNPSEGSRILSRMPSWNQPCGWMLRGIWNLLLSHEVQRRSGRWRAPLARSLTELAPILSPHQDPPFSPPLLQAGHPSIFLRIWTSMTFQKRWCSYLGIWWDRRGRAWCRVVLNSLRITYFFRQQLSRREPWKSGSCRSQCRMCSFRKHQHHHGVLFLHWLGWSSQCRCFLVQRFCQP